MRSLTREHPAPSVSTVALSLVAAAILQFPVHLMIRAGFIFASIAFNELAVMLGIPLILVLVLKFNSGQIFNFRKIDIAAVFLVIVGALAAVVLIDYLTALSEHFFPLPGWMQATIERLMSVSGASDILWKIFLLCILPAICEEIFFRGFCQTSLSSRWGSKIAIVSTSLIFAALHLNPWHFHIYFILSLFLGWLYQTTGTLWAPIICHLINNLWTFVCHQQKFKLPVGPDFNWINWAIIGISLMIFAATAGVLKKREAQGGAY